MCTQNNLPHPNALQGVDHKAQDSTDYGCDYFLKRGARPKLAEGLGNQLDEGATGDLGLSPQILELDIAEPGVVKESDVIFNTLDSVSEEVYGWNRKIEKAYPYNNVHEQRRKKRAENPKLNNVGNIMICHEDPGRTKWSKPKGSSGGPG